MLGRSWWNIGRHAEILIMLHALYVAETMTETGSTSCCREWIFVRDQGVIESV